jgi:hypothetical protein
MDLVELFSFHLSSVQKLALKSLDSFIKGDIFTVIECGFKKRFVCLLQGFNTLVVFA